MLAIFFFGRAVEQVLGKAEFYRFYFVAVVVSGLAWVLSVNVFSGDYLPGRTYLIASGGVMAVLAVFVWYFPRQEVLIWGVLPVPAWARYSLLCHRYSRRDSRRWECCTCRTYWRCSLWTAVCLERLEPSGLSDLGGRLKQMRRRFKIVRPDDDLDHSQTAGEDGDSLQLKVDEILEKLVGLVSRVSQMMNARHSLVQADVSKVAPGKVHSR